MSAPSKMVSCALLALWACRCEALPISGRVVDHEARPVAGAQVAVYEKYRLGNSELGRMAGPVVQTDRQGDFALQADISSQYDTFIVARKEGLALAWDGLNYGRNTLGRGHFLLVLERPAELSGTVVDPAGRPVAAARVQALPKTSYLSRLRQRPVVAPEEWFSTQTDADGRFRFGTLSADVSADFRVRAPGWASTYEFSPHYLDACGFEVGRDDIRLMLPQEGKITGRVIDGESGEPVGNVELMIRPQRQQVEDIANLYIPSRTVSDTNGNFVFAGVPRRQHVVEISPPEEHPCEWVGFAVEVQATAGAVTAHTTVSVTRGGLIELTVRGEYTGRPLGRIRAYANEMDRPFHVQGLTDEHGRIRFRVPPGQHEVSVWSPGFLSWRAPDVVPVGLGETVRLEASLHPLDHASGSVRDRQGAAVAGALVALHPFGDHVYTDSTGRFIAAPDERGGRKNLWAMALDLAGDRAAAVRVVEKDKPVELALEPALHVTGRVADVNKVPLPAARVALYVHLSNCMSDLGTETLTDPNGRFGFIVAPPVEGVFDYCISIHATDYGPKLYDKVALRGEPGDTRDLGTFTLPRADTSIAGVVVDGDGVPAPRIPIFLHGRRPVDQPDKTTATNEQGQFRITRVCAATLRLQANFDTSPGGSSSIDAQGGQQDIRIVLPGHLSTYPSLMGKPLPDLNGIIATPLPPDTKDKMMLVCFFDMDQRPSRRGLAALARQADELKRQGITVIAVHAGKTDKDAVQRWAVEQGLSFPVGTLAEDATRVKFAWGAQSLPWLILADTQHIVRAEGFAVSELESRVEAIRKTSGAARTPSAPSGHVTDNERTAVCLIKDPQDRVLANDRIAISPATAEAPTDAEGKLSIRYAPPADPRGLLTYLRHKDPDLIGAAWLPPAGGEVEVKLEPAVSVQGRVLDPNGRPLGGVQVAALPMSSQFVLTDAAGNFDIAWAREWEPGENLCLMARQVESNGAALVDIDRETKTVEIRLEPALTLAGVIEDDDAKPIPEARVGLSLRKSWRCFTPVEPVTTDAAGGYAFRALPQNQEYVLFARAADYWEDGISTGLIYNKQNVANPGRFVLRKPILSVSGIVVDGAGKPIANIQVGTKDDHQPDRTAQTDAEGRFTLQGVCRGDVEVWAKRERAFYGTIATQAGRQDVRLVVQPIH